jgi:hypothetical protein
LTNLGIKFFQQGRLFEAIQEFNRAIAIDENPIAFLQKGICLLDISNTLYDQGHSLYFQKEAYFQLKYVHDTRETNLDEDHLKAFEKNTRIIDFIEWYEKNSPKIRHLSDLSSRKGKSKKEKNYLNWCLENKLFINDLNDISNEGSVNQDIICLPSIVCKINPLITITETLAMNAAFSEIKYQYAFARFNYYDAITSKQSVDELPHYSDKNLHLVNSLDFCVYRKDIEMTKVSFRLIYSCLDKIAVLLKKYLDLAIKDTRVHFSQIWYEQKNYPQDKIIREVFLNSKNPFFLALYWLSRDINDNEEDGHGYWIDPNAEKLADIRNKMEHQGFRVVIDDLYKITQQATNQHLDKKNTATGEQLKEKIKLKGYPLVITDLELKEQTLRLMKKVRYAIIYIALGIHYEEEKNINKELIFPMSTPML